MCKKVGALVLLLSIFALSLPAAAHPGKLDAYGGHHKTADGTYHYHLGADRKVEYASPPNGSPTRPPATPKPSETPRPKESAAPPAQPAEEEQVRAVPDGAVPPSGPEPAVSAPLSPPQPSFYPMEATPAPAAPFRIPLTKPFFVTLFVLGGLMAAFLLSFLIFAADQIHKKQ